MKFLLEEDGSLSREKLVLIIFEIIAVLISSGMTAFFLGAHLVSDGQMPQKILLVFLFGCMIIITMLIIFPKPESWVTGKTSFEKVQKIILIIIAFGSFLAMLYFIGWLEIKLLQWSGVM